MPFNFGITKPTGNGAINAMPSPFLDPSQNYQNAHENQMQAAQLGFQGQQAAADRAQQTAGWNFQAGQSNLDRLVQQQQAAAQRDFSNQQLASTQGFEGQQAAAQRDFTGQQNAAQRGVDLQIGMAPWDYKNKVFGTISPLISGLLGGGGGGGAVMGGGGSGAGHGGIDMGMVGGQNTPQPTITAGPVWNDQTTQAEVNAQKANNAAGAASQQQALQRQLAGQGFGGNSPLLTALSAGVNMNRLGADNAAQRETNFMASKDNAQQLLAGQTAQEQQWTDAQNADIQRRQTQMTAANQSQQIQNNYTTSLLAALAGMV